MSVTLRKVLCVIMMAAGLTGAASAMDPRPGVKLRALDKITGVAQDFVLNIDETRQLLGLTVTLRACYQSPPEQLPPESAAYMEVKTGREKATEDGEAGLAFSGWMFASSPGLNALEDPVYDVWVTSCMASAPVSE